MSAFCLHSGYLNRTPECFLKSLIYHKKPWKMWSSHLYEEEPFWLVLGRVTITMQNATVKIRYGQNKRWTICCDLCRDHIGLLCIMFWEAQFFLALVWRNEQYFYLDQIVSRLTYQITVLTWKHRGSSCFFGRFWVKLFSFLSTSE